MPRFLNELYLTAFSIFFRAGGSAWTPSINAWKGVVGVALFEGALLIGIAAWVNVLAGTKTLLAMPKWAQVGAFLALCLANHYPLVVRGLGITFERKFTSLQNSKKIFLLTSCVMVMLTIIVFFIFSARAHRRFLGIHD